MDWVVGPIIEIVKLFGGGFVRYLKYQIKYNDLLQKLEQSKQRLRSRKDEIESERKTQLQSAPYRVVKAEVEDWLKEAEEFIGRQDVVEEVNSRGYLSCCCRAVILEERTQELKEIYDRGDKYTKECLFIEDHSKKLNYYVQNFKELKEKLQCKQGDVGLTLQSQLVYWKIEKEEVKHWRGKVEEMLKGVRDIEDKIGGSLSHSSSDSLVMLLGEKIPEMERMCEEGSQLPDCFVIEDHSKKLNYYVKNFNELKEKLQCKQVDIGSKLNLQLVHGKIEMKQVKHWRGKVEEMLKGVKDIEDKIGGRLSNSSDLPVGLLGEKIQEMKSMCEEGSQLPDCLVIDDPSASAVKLPVSKLRGNEAVKAKILAYLTGEEVAKLGVWGMGGIGKTTIMKHVHNKLQEQPNPKFKKIIWVTVSQNFDINNLQEQIACRVKEQLLEKTDRAMRAGELFQMLKEDKHRPFMLILDDVWERIDLNEVGIPEPDVTNGCKLVLTTRSKEIIREMDCRAIKVETLPREEALKLFEKKVGDHLKGIKMDLGSTLEEIVDECDGLPLALITVAGSLKGIYEPRLWSAALNQLRDCKRNVAGTDADEFKILKFSYDRLKNQQIKYCFLYCALYPEDYNIPKEEIIEYWIDEGFIDEMETRQAMKDEGLDILMKLEDNSLLESGENTKSGECVRMHDVIRDMALDITRRSSPFLVEAGKALRELPERVKCAKDVEKVSLMFNKIEEIPSSMASSTCTSLTTLLLAYNDLSTIPESVFEHMPELKILDLSFNIELRSLPNSISKLVKLTALLLESTSLEKVPSLSGLGSLKKLNLRDTEIKEVPEGLGMLTNLKCLFLCGSKVYGNILEIDEIADGVLSNLSKLEELIVDWSKIELKGDVVRRLKKLEVFHGRFPTVNDMRIFLQCQPNRLSTYFITVGSNLKLNKPYDLTSEDCLIYGVIEELPRYKKIMVLKETSIVGENMLFPSVQLLCIKACQDIRSLNDFSAIKDAAIDLRRCLIWNCGGMECVLSSWINNPVVQTLEYLDLHGLRKLDGLFEAKVIAESPPPPGTFSSLKNVRIWLCKKIKKLFPSWNLVEYLQSLERIEVYHCEQMEEIIASDPEEEGGEGGDITKKLILPKLKYLSLYNLPALKSICSRRAVMVCDSLENIQIRNCKGLRKIPLYLPLVDNAQSSRPVEYLQSLQKIYVEKCEEIEEIIASDPEQEGEGGDITKRLILPKLKYLSLYNLPTLKSICSRRAIMVCDSLENIQIRHCKGLRRIPLYLPLVDNAQPSCPVEYLQSLEEIKVSYCEEMEEIIASDPEEEGEGGDITKRLILPELKYLSLYNLPALKSICSRRAVMVCDSLKNIQIRHCKGLRRIPLYLPLVDNAQPSRPMKYLRSLQKIYVEKCEEMEEIIASDPEEEGEGGDITKRLILPKLKYLSLYNLPALKSICSTRAIMVFDSLKSIHINNCKGLGRIPFRLPPDLFLEEFDELDWVFEGELIATSPPQPSSFASLNKVTIQHCKRAKKLFPSWKLVEYLQSLETIEVGGCEEMEEIIASDPEEEGEGGDIIKKLILPKLKQLRLWVLPALKSICSRRAVMVCDSLQHVEIRDCKGLRRIPLYLPLVDNAQPSRPVEYLQSLEEIRVSYCEEMEEIIASDPEEEGEGGDITKRLILPKLKYLSLYNLPALKSICSTRVITVCDSLESIHINNCKRLRRIPFRLPPDLFLKEFDDLDWVFEGELSATSPPQPSTFSSLKKVDIRACKKVKKLFPSWKLVEYLQSLEEIRVFYCEEMEEIIASDPEEEVEGGDIIKKFILPKLKYLYLGKLLALKSICSTRAVIVCDSLKKIIIMDCKGLRRIPLCLDNAQPSPPLSLEAINVHGHGAKWCESLEWDHPNAKDVLRPLLHLYPSLVFESKGE